MAEKVATGTIETESEPWPRLIVGWIRTAPLAAALLVAIVTTLVVFFGFVPLFIKGVYSAGLASTAAWAWKAWDPSGEQFHSRVRAADLFGFGFVSLQTDSRCTEKGCQLGFDLSFLSESSFSF